MAIIHMVGIDKMCSIMAVDNEELALATCNFFQCVNDSLTGGDKREYGKEEALVLGETESSSEHLRKSRLYYGHLFSAHFLIFN